MKTETQCIRLRNRKESPTETSSERPLEYSEIATSKNYSFCYSDVHTKNKMKNWMLDQKLCVRKSKNTTIRESVAKREWENTKIPKYQGKNQRNWHIK